MPDPFGVQGPGEITISGINAAISSVSSSLRLTSTSAPSSQKYWYKFRERIIVVDKQDHSGSGKNKTGLFYSDSRFAYHFAKDPLKGFRDRPSPPAG